MSTLYGQRNNASKLPAVLVLEIRENQYNCFEILGSKFLGYIIGPKKRDTSKKCSIFMKFLEFGIIPDCYIGNTEVCYCVYCECIRGRAGG